MNGSGKRIVLTGFMGTGKTAVATVLARRLDCRMIDLDKFIEVREGRRIGEIIDEDGEVQFREIETRALMDTLQYRVAHVIALGGGTSTLERNRKLLELHDCFTVWLDAPFELCWQRITNEGNLRPLARDQEKAKRLYYQRQDSYALATLRVEVGNDSSVDELAAKIFEELPD